MQRHGPNMFYFLTPVINNVQCFLEMCPSDEFNSDNHSKTWMVATVEAMELHD